MELSHRAPPSGRGRSGLGVQLCSCKRPSQPPGLGKPQQHRPFCSWLSLPCDAILHSRLQGTYMPLSLHRVTGLSVQDPGWSCLYLSIDAPGLRTFEAQPPHSMDEPRDTHQIKLSRGQDALPAPLPSGKPQPQLPCWRLCPPGPLQGSPGRV